MTTASITFQQANDILKNDFPSREQLRRFPFSEQLTCLFFDSSESEMARSHGANVLGAMNKLLGKDPGKLIESIDNTTQQRFEETKLTIGKLFSNFDENAQALFRIAALYHDIGKYIIKERHPTIGWYTLEYLNADEKSALRSLLGNREDYLQLLMIMVRDHDEFGVLSTGEASYPILLRPVNSLGNDLYNQSQIISAIMWLNLADIAGTPGIILDANDVNKVIDDWEWFLHALDESYHNNESLDNYVIRKASKERYVVRRISRLLTESSRNIKNRLDELKQKNERNEQDYEMQGKWIGRIGHQVGDMKGNYEEAPDRLERLVISQLVRNQLETVYGTTIPKRDFCNQFTHICKLDYGKRFFSLLVEYCEGYPQPGDTTNRTLQEWSKERVSTEKMIYNVLAILRRITSTYTSMSHIENDVGNLIGVEMKDLTPANAPEKTARIIQLLRDSHYPGLSWMMSDCLAWYF